VNLKQGSVCGDLSIKGLTPEYAELTTFFEGEIVGAAEHTFLEGLMITDRKSR
jgi:hypothetical protein